MKKLFLAMMAVAAITLTSCLGKTSTPGQGDPQAEAPNEVSELTKALESQLNSGNGEGFFGLVTNIQEKAIGFIKDNPEKAKEYLGTAQKFLKDNSAKISELLGKISNTEIAERAQDFIKSVSEQPVDQLLGVMGVVGGAQEAVGEQIDSVKNAVGEKIDEVTGAVDEVKGAVDQKVNDVKNVIDQAGDVKDAIGNVLGN
ncbi:MAG: hypothetical protein K6D55_02285 [Prevotella sp.]|nr:hypothetical protein [Prevotella sp.]